MSRSLVNEMTWPEACTPASVRPAALILTAPPKSALEHALEFAGDGSHFRLKLQTAEVRAVVLDDGAIGRH